MGHAYERATEWHTTATADSWPGRRRPTSIPPPVLSESGRVGSTPRRAICACKAARRAGLQLDDLMLAQLLEGAPYALGMVQRLRRDHDLQHEPANVFSLPPSRLGEP